MITEHEQMAVFIRQVCYDVAELLIEKNRKYGNSALHPVRIFSRASTLEQLNVRMDDKLSRIAAGEEDEDEDPELELLGYLVLKRVAQILQEQGQSELEGQLLARIPEL